MIYPPFSLPHIVYLIFSVIFLVYSGIRMRSTMISNKNKLCCIRTIALFLLCSTFLEQVLKAVRFSAAGMDNSVFYVFPNSFCTFVSACISILVLLKKTDHSAMNFLVPQAIIGCTPAVISPDYLNYQPFFSLETICGLVNHALVLWIALALVLSGYFKASTKKYLFYPLYFTVMIAYGYILVYVFGIDDCMNITKPLIAQIKISYWYGLFAVACPVAYIATYLLSKIKPLETEPKKSHLEVE